LDAPAVEYILKKLSICHPTHNCIVNSLSLFAKSLYPIYKIVTHNRVFACKEIDFETMARSETQSLQYLKDSGAYVPTCYGYCTYNGKCYILMDFIEPDTGINESAIYESLSMLYQNKSDLWGWLSPTFIGAIYQENKNMHKNFLDFWWLERIEPLLRKCLKSQWITLETSNQVESVIHTLSQKWELDKSVPHLIHGDLWSGNVVFGKDGKMYLIDPSISFGHPEQDIAMMKMFGGFSGKKWLERLSQEIPLATGIEERIPFWQIYPTLVHILLFGSGYTDSLRAIVKRYL
jgi:fructosamine-3-kinase